MESSSKAVGNAARRLDAMLTKARAAHAGAITFKIFYV
jgi:hypothetical protein